MSGSAWNPGAGIINVDAESTNLSQVFTAADTQVVFTLTEFTYTPGTGSIAVYLNGQKLLLNLDYVETSSSVVSITGPSLVSGDKVEVCGIVGAASVSAAAAAESLYYTQLIEAELSALYLGSHESDPLVDNKGNSLLAGALYLNTTGTPKTRVYNGATWQDVGTYSSTTTTSIDASLYASQIEAEQGINDAKVVTPLKVKQSIAAQVGTTLEAYDATILKSADIGTTVQSQLVVATQAEMEAGAETALRSMSPLRVKQAINVLGLVTQTAQTTTSGTAIDFTGIPSTAKRVTMMFNSVSSNGTSGLLIQAGAGSVQTTGYSGTAVDTTATGNAVQTSTAGFPMRMVASTFGLIGCVQLSHMGGNIWVVSGCVGRSTQDANQTIVGSVTISGALDRIRLTTANGTDTFDAGSVNISYE